MRAKRTSGYPLDKKQYASFVSTGAAKFHWMREKGYTPHAWQALFHAMSRDDKTQRSRHLVAGRRGGKTLSAAWEVLYYCVNPSAWWADARGMSSTDPLWVWCITKTFRAGRPALLTFLSAVKQAGLTKGVDYTYNKTERIIEFSNGTVMEFRSAENPDDLRGPGLHILWFDEAAFLPSEDAFLTVYPALADTKGSLITTTTPNSKNWYHEKWWADGLDDPDTGSVEYWSLDNPHFSAEEWKRYEKWYHPLYFEQEFKASFDAMVGLDLHGEWLQYHTLDEMEADKLWHPLTRRYKGMSTYLGIDPAISTTEAADHFAMSLIGVADTGRVYLLETIKTKMDFADQLQLIHQWHMKFAPTLIGIESNAFQAVLSQQAQRLAGMPPIVPILNAGKKNDRIMQMSPLFKIGKATLLESHRDFQHEWINFEYANRHNEDDLLDATEIALQTAGSLHAVGDRSWNSPILTPSEEDWGKIGTPEHEELFSQTAAAVDEEFGDDW